jgi:hypothetical protein
MSKAPPNCHRLQGTKYFITIPTRDSSGGDVPCMVLEGNALPATDPGVLCRTENGSARSCVMEVFLTKNDLQSLSKDAQSPSSTANIGVVPLLETAFTSAQQTYNQDKKMPARAKRQLGNAKTMVEQRLRQVRKSSLSANLCGRVLGMLQPDNRATVNTAWPPVYEWMVAAWDTSSAAMNPGLGNTAMQTHCAAANLHGVLKKILQARICRGTKSWPRIATFVHGKPKSKTDAIVSATADDDKSGDILLLVNLTVWQERLQSVTSDAEAASWLWQNAELKCVMGSQMLGTQLRIAPKRVVSQVDPKPVSVWILKLCNAHDIAFTYGCTLRAEYTVSAAAEVRAVSSANVFNVHSAEQSPFRTFWGLEADRGSETNQKLFGLTGQRADLLEFCAEFLGRQLTKEEQYIIQQFCESLVVFKGPPGCGKTELLCALVAYLVHKTDTFVVVSADTQLMSDELCDRIRAPTEFRRMGFDKRSGSDHWERYLEQLSRDTLLREWKSIALIDSWIAELASSGMLPGSLPGTLLKTTPSETEKHLHVIRETILRQEIYPREHELPEEAFDNLKGISVTAGYLQKFLGMESGRQSNILTRVRSKKLTVLFQDEYENVPALVLGTMALHFDCLLLFGDVGQEPMTHGARLKEIENPLVIKKVDVEVHDPMNYWMSASWLDRVPHQCFKLLATYRFCDSTLALLRAIDVAKGLEQVTSMKSDMTHVLPWLLQPLEDAVQNCLSEVVFSETLFAVFFVALALEIVQLNDDGKLNNDGQDGKAPILVVAFCAELLKNLEAATRLAEPLCYLLVNRLGRPLHNLDLREQVAFATHATTRGQNRPVAIFVAPRLKQHVDFYTGVFFHDQANVKVAVTRASERQHVLMEDVAANDLHHSTTLPWNTRCRAQRWQKMLGHFKEVTLPKLNCALNAYSRRQWWAYPAILKADCPGLNDAFENACDHGDELWGAAWGAASSAGQWLQETQRASSWSIAEVAAWTRRNNDSLGANPNRKLPSFPDYKVSGRAADPLRSTWLASIHVTIKSANMCTMWVPFLAENTSDDALNTWLYLLTKKIQDELSLHARRDVEVVRHKKQKLGEDVYLEECWSHRPAFVVYRHGDSKDNWESYAYIPMGRKHQHKSITGGLLLVTTQACILAVNVLEEKGGELHTVEGDVSLVPEFVNRAVHVSDASSTQILTLAEQ